MPRNWIYEKAHAGGVLAGAAGPAGSVQYNGGNSIQAGDANLTWDAANKTLLLSGSETLVGLASNPALSAAGQARVFYQTGGQLMVSYNGAAYVPLGGGGAASAVGPTGAVQYQKGGGVFAGDAGLVFDPAAGTPPAALLTTTNITATGRILANGSYSLATSSAPAISSAGYAKWYYDGTQLLVSYNGAAYVPLSPGQTPWLSDIDGAGHTLYGAFNLIANNAILISGGTDYYIAQKSGFTWSTLVSGVANARWNMVKDGPESDPTKPGYVPGQGADLYIYRNDDGGNFAGVALMLKRSNGWMGVNGVLNPSAPLHVKGTANTAVIECDTGFVQSDQGFFTPVTADTALSAPNGGSHAFRQIAINSFIAEAVVGPLSNNPAYPQPAANQGKLYFDATSKRWWATEDTGAPFPLRAGGVAGTDTQVQYNRANGFSADGNLIWDYTGQALKVTGKAGGYSIYSVGGYIQSDGGFQTNTATDLMAMVPLSLVWNTYVGGGATPGFKDRWRITKDDVQAGGGYPGDPAGTHNLHFYAAKDDGSYNHTAMTLERSTGYVGILDNFNPAFPLHVSGASATDTAFVMKDAASAPAGPGAGYGGLAHQSGSVYFYYNGSAWNTVDLSTVSGQTPWKQNIDGANFNLTNAGQIIANTQVTVQSNPVAAGSDLVAIRLKDVLWNTYISGGFKECWRITKEDAGVPAGTKNLSFWASDDNGGFLSTVLCLQRTTGFVGIGNIINPVSHVHVQGSGSTIAVTLDAYDVPGGLNAIPSFIGRRAATSNGLPNGSFFYLPSGAILLAIGGRGTTPSGFTAATMANMVFATSEQWDVGKQGTEINFATTRSGTTTRKTWLYLRNDGLLEHQGGAWIQAGLQLDGFLALQTTSSAPLLAPNTGHGGLSHQSGSLYWYFNVSTGSWATVDFAKTGGGSGGISTINGQSGPAVTLTGFNGIAISVPSTNTIQIGFDGLGSISCANVTVAQNISAGNQLTINGNIVCKSAGIWLAGVQCSDHVYALDFGIMTSTPGLGKATGAGSTTSADAVGLPPPTPASSQPAFTVACSDGYNRPVRGGIICQK